MRNNTARIEREAANIPRRRETLVLVDGTGYTYIRTRARGDEWRPITGHRASDWHGLFAGATEAGVVTSLVAYAWLLSLVWGSF